MKWQDVIEHPSLKDLPFKIELDENGKIIMSPTSNRHGRLQVKLSLLLAKYASDGELYLECSIDTRKGVKVADVAWSSPEFFAEYGEITPLPVAPEICIEIVSPSNSQREMMEKIDLYSAKGAQEVWLCDDDGHPTIHTPKGMIQRSNLITEFPSSIL
ncbi:Uma2 family endonuclease [Dactylococcopsis salina]|uniref:Putative restriction endonuclease domain-containing protein n=1 Tax=Dactylococcopsis salina (strain PCC 8305) TaxID=13035 RepID=K9YXC5_DACS8|nr:Uma2 family endonuclease [Dactylococcopsis salina]AFZ51581.1 hypothetical protein Dacsa_3048 [Dactylococcopsis salina PCC 8305]